MIKLFVALFLNQLARDLGVWINFEIIEEFIVCSFSILTFHRSLAI